MPVLRALALDIRKPTTHTCLMLKSRKGVLLRMLPLLGLVLALFMAVGSVEAQMTGAGSYLRSTNADDYAFPFLSPDIDQKNILMNAFSFQMQIFGGIDGANAGVEALRYLALTAFLIGALMLIFNAKYRKVIIVASWLLVVIITLFAPYGSKVLFYPLSTKGIIFNSAAASETVTDCKDNPRFCGFAPQLAAVHVGSLMQVLFSDLFNSRQWKGLIESSNAQKALATEPKLNSQSWRDSKRDLKQCSGKVGWYEALQQRFGSANVKDEKFDAVLSDRWDLLKDKYKNWSNLGQVMTAIPDAFVLYDKDTLPESWKNNDRVLSAYLAGITELYQSITREKKVVDLDSTDDGTNISLNEALQALDDKGFFKAEMMCVREGVISSKCILPPGYFFVWERKSNSVKDDDNPALDMRRCWGAPDNLPADDAALMKNEEYLEYCVTGVKDGYYNPGGQMNSFNNILKPDADLAGTLWENLLQGKDKLSSESNISQMPVGIAIYKPNEKVAYPPKVSFDSGVSCLARWNSAIDSAIADTLGNADKYTSQMTPLRKLLMEGSEVAVAVEDGKPVLPPIYDKTQAEKGKCAPGNERVSGYEECSNAGLAKSIQTSFERMYRDKVEQLNPRRALTPEENYEVLLTLIVGSIDQSTDHLAQSNASARAAEESGDVTVVGSDALTAVAGFGAKFFGTVLVKIASWFTGPVASAYIFFLSILVNLALISLIVLTPILFLFGLAMPGAAIGLLTISVLGVFVLKFVPVTLLILNNIGGMIYDILGGGGSHASTMQDLMIIAMAGLYTNIVGMSFFLLFKMGDASAMLSRFTALDSSAKQLADRGIATTIAAAGIAATAVGAAGLAAAGHLTRQDAIRRAATAAGIPSDWIEAAQKGVADDKVKNAENTINETSTSEQDEPLQDSLSEEEQMRKTTELFDEHEEGSARERLRNRKRVDAADAIATAEQVHGLSPEEARQLVDDGRFVKTDANGDMWEYQLTKDNDVYGVSSPTLVGRNGVMTAESSSSFTPSQIEDMSKSVGDIKGSGSSEGEPPLEPGPATGPAGQVTQAGGVATTVTIAGGSLDSVGEVGGIQQQAAVGETDRVSQIRQERDAQAKADEIEQYQGLSNKVDDAGKAAIARMASAKTDEEYNLAKREADASALRAGTSAADSERQKLVTRNMNDQIAEALVRFDKQHADEFADIEARKKNNLELTDHQKDLVKLRAGLSNFDTAAATQGEIMSRLGTFESLNASFSARGAADQLPSLGKTMLSGLYGAFSGTGGGLARIPVIGPAITESLNEYYQAPERARAWNSVGGWSKWKELQGDAQRMGFYQKEMSPIAAGQQYQSMMAIGGFQAQADIARQAANEAVARSRSQWDAMVASRDPDLKMRLTNEIKSGNKDITDVELRDELSKRFNVEINKPEFRAHMTAGELAGLGAMDAADKIASVRQEAFLAKGAPLTVKRVKGGLDGNMMLTSDNVEMEDVNVVLTPDALARVKGDLTTKSLAGNIDGMMMLHYGLAEKQYLRGDAGWDATRNMNTSVAAATMFARKDIDTDYLVSGHLKMVQGKERFMEMRGQYKTLLDFRNESSRMVSSRVQELFQSVGNDLGKAAAKANIDVKGLAPIDVRAKFDKWATDDLKAQGAVMPLNILFDAATTKGIASYTRKAATAFYEGQSEAAETWMKTQKAAAAAFAASLPSVANLSKNISFEKDGIKYDIGKSTEKLFEKFDMALGSRATEAIKVFNDYFSDERRQKTAFDIKVDKSKDGAPKGWMRVDKAEFENYCDVLNKNSPGLGDKLRGYMNDGKTIRDRGNQVEWGYVDENEAF